VTLDLRAEDGSLVKLQQRRSTTPSSADDSELVEKLPLTDDEGPVGTLLLGRRSDRNRYNRQQLEAVEELIPSLAEALRIARSHHSRENEMQRRLEEMAARLAQLEGGGPKPKPV
jgi:hypothetical protein